MPRTSITVEVQPFPVPTGVALVQQPGLRQDGFRPAPTLKLTELSPIDLDRMCEEFRTAVFEAAGYNPMFNRVQKDADYGDVLPGSEEALNRR